MVKDDVFIIDFEGEPRRSIDQRRLKTSPLRDVAGMLRSFDYAAWSALDKLSARGIQLTPERRALAFKWRDEATRSFLGEYRTTLEDNNAAGGKPAADGLLQLFLLHKAFYEVGYELGSRPAWLSVPLRGILDLLEQWGPA